MHIIYKRKELAFSPFICYIIFANAGVVQWLVCDLAKVEMGVRFSSLAPLRELLTPSCEFYITKKSYITRRYGIFSCLEGGFTNENNHRVFMISYLC